MAFANWAGSSMTKKLLLLSSWCRAMPAFISSSKASAVAIKTFFPTNFCARANANRLLPLLTPTVKRILRIILSQKFLIQQPQKERAANDRGHDPHRDLRWGDHGPGKHITQRQERPAEQKRRRR